jgi:hypothetical protein
MSKHTTVIDIDDSDYRRSHMTSPRGRGSWAFQIGGSSLPMIWTPSMTYADAKVWAKAAVRQMIAAGAIPASVSYIDLRTQP